MRKDLELAGPHGSGLSVALAPTANTLPAVIQVRTRAAVRYGERRRILLLLLSLTIATSAVVRWEPAPYDGLILALLVPGFSALGMRFPTALLAPLAIITLFLLTNLFPCIWVPGEFVGGSIKHTIVTGYLVVSWIYLSGWFYSLGTDAVEAFFRGYVGAAVISAILGILGILFPAQLGDYVLWAGRAVGFFKDPNVYGPFLVPAAVYCYHRLAHERQRALFLLWTFGLLLTALGTILSMSRGAWANLLLALGLYTLLALRDRAANVGKACVFLAIGAFLGVVSIFTVPQVQSLMKARTTLQSYDTIRFQNQQKALDRALDDPIGIGGIQSHRVFGQDVHSTPILVFAEYGWVGGISFFLFLLLTAGKAVDLLLSSNRQARSYGGIGLCSLLGFVLNGAMVDILHWRHIWLVFAVIWGVERRRS